MPSIPTAVAAVCASCNPDHVVESSLLAYFAARTPRDFSVGFVRLPLRIFQHQTTQRRSCATPARQSRNTLIAIMARPRPEKRYLTSVRPIPGEASRTLRPQRFAVPLSDPSRRLQRPSEPHTSRVRPGRNRRQGKASLRADERRGVIAWKCGGFRICQPEHLQITTSDNQLRKRPRQNGHRQRVFDGFGLASPVVSIRAPRRHQRGGYLGFRADYPAVVPVLLLHLLPRDIAPKAGRR